MTNTHLKYTASGTKPNSSLNCFVLSFISLGGNLKKLGLKGYTKHHQRFYHSWFHPDYRWIFRCFLRSQKIYFFCGGEERGENEGGTKNGVWKGNCFWKYSFTVLSCYRLNIVLKQLFTATSYIKIWYQTFPTFININLCSE